MKRVAAGLGLIAFLMVLGLPAVLSLGLLIPLPRRVLAWKLSDDVCCVYVRVCVCTCVSVCVRVD